MNPLWLLFLLPLVSAAVIHFVLKQKYASIAALVGTISTGITLVLALLWVNGSFTETPAFDWIAVGAHKLQIGLVDDQLANQTLGAVILVELNQERAHVRAAAQAKLGDESRQRKAELADDGGKVSLTDTLGQT